MCTYQARLKTESTGEVVNVGKSTALLATAALVAAQALGRATGELGPPAIARAVRNLNTRHNHFSGYPGRGFGAIVSVIKCDRAV